MSTLISITKRFANLPFAHRQHLHDGHCRLIHGHNWDFEVELRADSLDENGFVVDFGKLKWMRQWFENNFDHTLVLNEADPALRYLREGLCDPAGSGPEVKELFPFAKIVVVPNCGAEGLAKWVLWELNRRLREVIGIDRNVRIYRVRAFEDEKNSAEAIAPALQ